MTSQTRTEQINEIASEAFGLLALELYRLRWKRQFL